MRGAVSGIILLGLFLAACQTAPVVETAATATLIPVTNTPRHTPTLAQTEPPTAEDTGLLASTLLALTPTPPNFVPDDDLYGSGLSPVVAELVQIARRRLVQQLGIPTQRVRLVSIEPYRWTDSSLGCPLPGQTYYPVISDGYRILLTAGDRAYYFHTDFDRVIQCEAGYERLPQGTTEPSPSPAPTLAQVG
jgi:hypothetical protein